MVQEKYDTWRLPCSLSRDRIATGSASASIRLSSIDSSYRGHPTPLFLARCNPRPPPTTELRADFLFLVSSDGLFLWRVFVGAQRAALLLDDSTVTFDFLLDRSLLGAVVSSFAPRALASRVCADSRTASPGRSKALMGIACISSRGVAPPQALRGAAITQRL